MGRLPAAFRWAETERCAKPGRHPASARGDLGAGRAPASLRLRQTGGRDRRRAHRRVARARRSRRGRAVLRAPPSRRGGCLQAVLAAEACSRRSWRPDLPVVRRRARRCDARERTRAQEAVFRRVVEENAEQVRQVHTRAELNDPRLRLVLSMEGVEPLEGDPGAFEEWYGRGVRTASLTWNHANEFAGGIDTPTRGLTDRGRALVRRFDELSVGLDLAHVRANLARRLRRRDPLLSDTRGMPRSP